MPNFAKLELSGTTDGAGLAIAATSGAGTTIHTATTAVGSDGNEYDEVWVWAANFDASPRTLGIQFGGTANKDHSHTTIPAQGGGAVLVVPGWILQNGLLCRATASVANVVNVFGYVNRVSRV